MYQTATLANGPKKSIWCQIKSSPSLRSCRSSIKLLKTIFINISNEVRHINKGVRDLELWKEDTFFAEILNNVKTRTLLTSSRLYSLYQLLQNSPPEGDVAELGVYNGGSARLLAKTLEKYHSGKNLFLFDTFEGLPFHDDKLDMHKSGDLQSNKFEEVKEYLNDCKNAIFYKGLFADTLQIVKNNIFSFVHIDADLYSSITECVEFFYPRLIKGGIIIFDDYGFVSCPGAKKAVDNLFIDKPEVPIYLPTGQCLVIKQ